MAPPGSATGELPLASSVPPIKAARVLLLKTLVDMNSCSSAEFILAKRAPCSRQAALLSRAVIVVSG